MGAEVDTMKVRLLLLFVFMLSVEGDIHLTVDWSSSFRTTTTAATVEVDVMPQLARTQNQSGFGGYMRALQQLGASYVRFAPWFGYPRVVVPEWSQTNCSGAGSSWNSTLLDGVVADFMTAVCGPHAAAGECADGLSVAPQLSTMPMWLYQPDGINRTRDFPESTPWQYVPGHLSHFAAHGTPLRDPTCKDMAAYAARYVGWYTAGGFTDECGVRHDSGLHYNWPFLSVLNEDEYNTPPGGGVQYTICWDAWQVAIRDVNPNITLIGPEIADLDYALYFMNRSHHSSKQPPPVVSTHVWITSPNRSGSFEQLFSGVDSWLEAVADPLGAARADGTELVMNEFIPENDEWCDRTQPGRSSCGGGKWKWASASTARPDQVTLGWNAAAAAFAYAFGTLAERGWKYVGADQLIGGPFPNNEAGVASLDWDTGKPNAKYWAVQMLARELGSGPKALFNCTMPTAATELYALGFKINSTRKILLVSKVSEHLNVTISEAAGASVTILEGVGSAPGWQPPRQSILGSNSSLNIGPYGIVLVSLK